MAKSAIRQKSTPPTRSTKNSYPNNHGELGRELRIGKKSHVYVNNPGFKVEYFVPSVELLFGIGKNHTASIIMDTDAWEALQKGEETSITTLQQYQDQFFNPRKKSKLKK